MDFSLNEFGAIVSNGEVYRCPVCGDKLKASAVWDMASHGPMQVTEEGDFCIDVTLKIQSFRINTHHCETPKAQVSST